MTRRSACRSGPVEDPRASSPSPLIGTVRLANQPDRRARRRCWRRTRRRAPRPARRGHWPGCRARPSGRPRRRHPAGARIDSQGTSRSLRLIAAKSSISGAPSSAPAALAAVTPGTTSTSAATAVTRRPAARRPARPCRRRRCRHSIPARRAARRGRAGWRSGGPLALLADLVRRAGVVAGDQTGDAVQVGPVPDHERRLFERRGGRAASSDRAAPAPARRAQPSRSEAASRRAGDSDGRVGRLLLRRRSGLAVAAPGARPASQTPGVPTWRATSADGVGRSVHGGELARPSRPRAGQRRARAKWTTAGWSRRRSIVATVATLSTASPASRRADRASGLDLVSGRAAGCTRRPAPASAGGRRPAARRRYGVGEQAVGDDDGRAGPVPQARPAVAKRGQSSGRSASGSGRPTSRKMATGCPVHGGRHRPLERLGCGLDVPAVVQAERVEGGQAQRIAGRRHDRLARRWRQRSCARVRWRRSGARRPGERRAGRSRRRR